MPYLPQIEQANPVRRFAAGDHRAVLLTDITSSGEISYTHILLVSKTVSNQIVLALAAEVNGFNEQFRTGSHAFGVFSGDGHSTMGFSDDWASLEKFEHRALEVAQERLNIEQIWARGADA